MFDKFYVDEKGNSVFTLPRQQKLQIFLGNNFTSVSAMMIDEKLDAAKMEKAIQTVFDAYDSLRYMAVEKDNEIYYKIVEDYRFELKPYVASGDDYEAKFRDATDYISRVASQPIDIYNGLSVFFGIVIVTDEQFILYMGAYPWTLDGTSCAVITDRILKEYRGIEIKIPYAVQNHEFMEWYLDFENSEKGQQELEFWKQNYEGVKKHGLQEMYVGQPASPADMMVKLDIGKVSSLAKKYKTSNVNVIMYALHLAAYNVFGLTDYVVPIGDSCRVKKEHICVVGNLVRHLGHRLKLDENAKLSEMFNASIDAMSKCVKNHHVAYSNGRTSDFGVTCNNFRQADDFFAKNITSKIRITPPEKEGQKEKELLLVIIAELPNGLNIIYRGPGKLTKEGLGIVTDTIRKVIDVLGEDKDMSVSEFKRFVLGD